MSNNYLSTIYLSTINTISTLQYVSSRTNIYLSTIQTISTLQSISTQTNENIRSTVTGSVLQNNSVVFYAVSTLVTENTIYQINTQSTINYLNSNLNSTIFTIQNGINNNISTINYYIDPKNYNSNVITSNIFISTNNDVWIRFININSTNARNAISTTTSTLNYLSNFYSVSLYYSSIGSNYLIPELFSTYQIRTTNYISNYNIITYNLGIPEQFTWYGPNRWRELNPYYISSNLSTTLYTLSINTVGLSEEIFPYEVDLVNLSTAQYYSSVLSPQVTLSTITVNTYLSTVSSLVYNANLVSSYNNSTIIYINASSLQVPINAKITFNFLINNTFAFTNANTSTITSLNNLYVIERTALLSLSTILTFQTSTVISLSTNFGLSTNSLSQLSTVAGASTLIGTSTLTGIYRTIRQSTVYGPVKITGLPSSLITTFNRISTLYTEDFGFLSSSTCNYLPLIISGVIDYNNLKSTFSYIETLLPLSYPIFSSTLVYTDANPSRAPRSEPNKYLYQLYYDIYAKVNLFYVFTFSLMSDLIPPYINASTTVGVSTMRGFSTINGFSSMYGYSTIGGVAKNVLFSSINGFSTLNTLQSLSTFASLQRSISTYINSDIVNINTLLSNINSTINSVVI